MKVFPRILMNLVVLSLLVISAAPVTTTGEVNEKGPLYFSLIPKKNVDNQISELRPLLHYLEKGLGRPIEVIRPQSYHTVIDGILSERIDFAILGPASYVKTKEKDKRVEAFASFACQQGLLTPEGSYYYSVLFTLKDSGNISATQLKGKKVALTDPESTSGAIIPNIYFSKDIGMAFSEFFGSMVYTGSHDRSIDAVKRRLVDAAFVSSVRIDEAVQKGIIDTKQVATLWKSAPIHYDPFVLRGGLDRSTKEKIKSLMLSPPPELEPMFTKMKMVGIVEVGDNDYEAIHELVAIQQSQGKSLD